MPIVSHFVFDRVKIFRASLYLKPHILFFSNNLAIWRGLSDIRHDEVIIADSWQY